MISDSDVVTVRGLGKADGDRVVVDGLDLDVGQGEVVGLLGANGAGKTAKLHLRRPGSGGGVRVRP